MPKKDIDTQLVVRIKSSLDERIQAAAEQKGLTKASWARQLILETLDKAEAQQS